ncbi:MAG: DUF711 family protein [Anaerolineales bacterium]|jgi:uncharacterized protein (UPF0210 family)
MNIRSITCFVNPHYPLNSSVFERAGSFIAAARPAYQSAGYTVQTSRLASTPFVHLLNQLDVDAAVQFAQAAEESATANGFEYLSLGPALPESPGSYEVIPDILEATENVFLAGVIASQQNGISLPAVRGCARVIHRAASITPDGFTNLRFAALANVPPDAPFFPAAYHQGDHPSFALATEAADLAVEACSNAGSLHEARQNIISLVEEHAEALSGVGEKLARQHAVHFDGIDFTLAPFPEAGRSLGTALETLGAPRVGQHGTLAAVAFLADAVDRAQFHRTGFSGVFLPLLEDAVLAARAAEGTLTITDLLLYSAVCGTGLDTIPLPGDTSEQQIAAVLLDLAALSQRLEKPLTARLMPVPGKEAGNPTDFDFDYFANSLVLPLRAQRLTRLFTGDEVFHLRRRQSP